MTKAEELAITFCKGCRESVICTTPCTKVLLSLFACTSKSIPEMEEMMKNARRKLT